MSRNVKTRIAAVMILAALIVFAGCEKEPAAQAPVKDSAATAQAETIVQTTCPMMEGNPIDKSLFVEYKGKKVYFCCKGCEKRFLSDPEKYVARLPQFKR